MGETRKIELGDIVPPVSPVELEVIIPQLNGHLTLLNMGTVNLKGNRDVATTTISSFFPSQESPFYRYIDMSPREYKARIENWRENKETKHLIITDMGVDLAILIDKCDFKVEEGGGDMYYTPELSEYRNLTVPTVFIPLQVHDNGLKQRPGKAVPAKACTVRSGDTPWGITEGVCENGTQGSRIYVANSAVIEAAAKQHGKSSSNNGWWTYPGTILAIP